uniref:Uncharacterized protein n=1 Tax=Panagrellus redivivus TaxID=6233 RepID=A0A7E4ULN5_PANRE
MSIVVQVTTDQFHTFEYDELMKLLRTQPRGFNLSIFVCGSCDRFEKFFNVLKPHLNEQLIDVNDDNDEDDFDYYGDDDDDEEYLSQFTWFEMVYKFKTYCWYLSIYQADVTAEKRNLSSDSSDDSGLPVAKKQKTTDDII